MTRTLSLFLTVALLSPADNVLAAERAQVLTLEGVGPVRIGMTVERAEKALGAKLHPLDHELYSDECWQTSRSDGIDPGISYMLANGTIVRIDIFKPANGNGPNVRTAEGIQLGSSEAEIKNLYGTALKIDQAPYYGVSASGDPVGLDLTFDSADHKSGILFETVDGKLRTFRTGLHAPLHYQEGCA